MNKKKTHNSADSLQQKLITTRYSVVEELVSVQESFSKEQLKLSQQKQKMQQLRKRLLQLENMEKANQQSAILYQQRTLKLEGTQGMAVALLATKIDNARLKEEGLEIRRNACSQMRASLSQSKRKALTMFEKLKSARIQRIRREEYENQLAKRRANESDSEERRSKSNKIKSEEIGRAERLKRYEQFRLAQARFNYDGKKSELLRAHAEKLNLLKELESKVGSAGEVFEKTKQLIKEVDQIQSLYITGQ